MIILTNDNSTRGYLKYTHLDEFVCMTLKEGSVERSVLLQHRSGLLLNSLSVPLFVLFIVASESFIEYHTPVNQL